MRKLVLLILLVLALAGIVAERRPQASNLSAFPYCGEVKNENYSGPCIVIIENGVITGD